jgi:WD40 repeat protein
MACSPNFRVVRLLQNAALQATVLITALVTPARAIAEQESAASTSATAATPAVPVTESPPPQLVLQTGHTSPVNAISFSPDGKLLASGSGEAYSNYEVNVVKLWDVSTGADLRTLIHEAPVRWIGFSADGRRVAAKGQHGKEAEVVRVWDVATGALIPDAMIDSEYVSSTTTADKKIAAEINGNDVKLKKTPQAANTCERSLDILPISKK